MMIYAAFAILPLGSGAVPASNLRRANARLSASSKPSPRSTGAVGFPLAVAIVAGLAAVVCCAGPVVGLVIGAGAGLALLGLLDFKWVFLGAGVAVLLLGVTAALWRSKRRCSVATHRRNRWRFPLLGLAIFVALYAAVNYALIPVLWDEASAKLASELDAQATAADATIVVGPGDAAGAAAARPRPVAVARRGATAPPASTAIAAERPAPRRQIVIPVNRQVDPRASATSDMTDLFKRNVAAVTSPAPVPDEVRQAQVKVDGIWCGACALAVQLLAMRTPGVVDYQMAYGDWVAAITYDPAQTSPATLMQNIRQAPGALSASGYGTTLLADLRLVGWTGPVGDPLPSGRPIVTYP